MDSENNVLVVLANKDFRDEEYVATVAVLNENGVACKIAASDPGDCVGVNGTTVCTDYTFDQVTSDQFDGILFVGGVGVERYFSNDLTLNLAQEFYNADKWTCAICWAPVVLAKAGILKGKKVTAWNGAQNEIEKAGATFTSEFVTIDGTIITANGPDSAQQFGQTIADKVLGM